MRAMVWVVLLALAGGCGGSPGTGVTGEAIATADAGDGAVTADGRARGRCLPPDHPPTCFEVTAGDNNPCFLQPDPTGLICCCPGQ